MDEAREQMRRLKAQYEVVCNELKEGATQYEDVKGQLLRAEAELEVIKKHIIKHRERRASTDRKQNQDDELVKKAEDDEDGMFEKKKKLFNESSVEPKVCNLCGLTVIHIHESNSCV